MSATKSQRFTISGRNLQFLKTVAEQMDEPNLNEVLKYLLCDVRGLGYKFGDKPQPQPQPQQAPIGYAFDPTTFEPAFAPIPEHNQNHIDPLIERLIASGLEMDF